MAYPTPYSKYVKDLDLTGTKYILPCKLNIYFSSYQLLSFGFWSTSEQLKSE